MSVFSLFFIMLFDTNDSRSHQNPFFCLRDPAIALHQQAREARELSGWVGGDQNGPSIFFQFKYIKKQDALIPNLASKIVYGSQIKSYEHFFFEIMKF